MALSSPINALFEAAFDVSFTLTSRTEGYTALSITLSHSCGLLFLANTTRIALVTAPAQRSADVPCVAKYVSESLVDLRCWGAAAGHWTLRVAHVASTPDDVTTAHFSGNRFRPTTRITLPADAVTVRLNSKFTLTSANDVDISLLSKSS